MVRSLIRREEPVTGEVAWELDEETIERRVRVKAKTTSAFTVRLTKRMERVDPALLAIARGDADPDDGHKIVDRRDPSVVPGRSAAANTFDAAADDDPFGGLIPVFDEGAPEPSDVDSPA